MTTASFASQRPARHRQANRFAHMAAAMVASLSLVHAAYGQFSSGSTGADGALNLTTPGTVVFDPVALGIDADADGIFHFTTVNIGSGVVVQLTVDKLGNRPVIWLASGNVQIDGNIDLSGAAGHSPNLGHPRAPAVPGPGGGAGGVGEALSGLPAQPGEGFGGGSPPNPGCNAAGDAGHRQTGDLCGGPAYGNTFLSPLLGGSGGGGGGNAGVGGAGGGGGGGALLIASSGTLTVSGAVIAAGGAGGFEGGGCFNSFAWGGGGSGGAIRLIASTVTGGGTLQAGGGVHGAGCQGALGGSPGRIRIESYHQEFVGSVTPAAAFSTPNVVFASANAPTVRVVSVDGEAVPANPTGSFVLPDVTISDGGPVVIAIEAHNIPLGTSVFLKLVPETGSPLTAFSDALAGTFEASTATATVTVPAGFSRFYVQASW